MTYHTLSIFNATKQPYEFTPNARPARKAVHTESAEKDDEQKRTEQAKTMSCKILCFVSKSFVLADAAGAATSAMAPVRLRTVTRLEVKTSLYINTSDRSGV